MAENKNPYIPNGSTPIKNEILFDIIAKGLLSYPEIRIAMYVVYKSWRYIDVKKRRRRDWTAPLKLSQIANDIGMKYPLVHRTVKRMIKRKVLLRDENRYQFNEHYEQYITKSDITKSDTNITKSDTNITKSDTNITKSDIIPLRNLDEHKQGFPLNKVLNKVLNKDINIEKRIKEKKSHTQPKREITFNKKTLQFEGITENDIKKWAEAYPEIDVQLEIKRMLVYLEGRRDKQNKKLWRKFITGWLSREVKGYKNNHKKGERYHGITTKLTEEEKRRIKEDEKNGITSWKAGEW